MNIDKRRRLCTEKHREPTNGNRWTCIVRLLTADMTHALHERITQIMTGNTYFPGQGDCFPEEDAHFVRSICLYYFNDISKAKGFRI